MEQKTAIVRITETNIAMFPWQFMLITKTLSRLQISERFLMLKTALAKTHATNRSQNAKMERYTTTK